MSSKALVVDANILVRAVLGKRVREVIEECRAKAATIVREQQTVLESLRDLLLVKKTIDAKALGEMLAGK